MAIGIKKVPYTPEDKVRKERARLTNNISTLGDIMTSAHNRGDVVSLAKASIAYTEAVDTLKEFDDRNN